MKFNPNDLPPHIKALNPHLFVRGMETNFAKPALAQALDDCRKERKGGAVCLVTLVIYGRRRLDSDNAVGACKPLRDAIAESIGIDDGDPRIRWEYGQVETRGQEGVMVKIETVWKQ